MVHPDCLDVGVGGFLLRGGMNRNGISNLYGSGASNVIEYKMVTADGNVIKVSQEGITSFSWFADDENGKKVNIYN